MQKYLLIIFLAVLPKFQKAQSSFEILIPWQEEFTGVWPYDTSATAFHVEETAEGDFIVLSNIQEFIPDIAGWPIEGFYTFGTGLMKISKEGDLVWKNWYQTSYLSGWAWHYRIWGRVPAKFFYLTNEGNIILPYSTFVGALICGGDSNFASESFKTAALHIDSETGSIIKDSIFMENPECESNEIIAAGISNENVLNLLYSDQQYKINYLEKRDVNLNLISKQTLLGDYDISRSSFYSKPIFDKATEYLLVTAAHLETDEANILSINQEGNLDFNTTLNNIKWPSFSAIEKIGSDYLTLIVKQRVEGPWGYDSYLFLISSTGQLLKEKVIQNTLIKDIAVNKTQQILLLENKSQVEILQPLYDGDSLLVRVWLLDTEFNPVNYKDFGFQYVIPSQISSTSDNGFVVLGTRLKSINFGDLEPDQIYLLKSNITNLTQSPQTCTNTIFPNPAKDIINVQLSFDPDFVPPAEATIYDFTGRLQASFLIDTPNPEIDISTLSKGIYYLTVEGYSGIKCNSKFVVVGE